MPPDRFGDCDPPHRGGGEIRIDPSLCGPKRAEILIHEALHACLPDISEESVTDTAVDITKLLEAEGVL